MTSELSKALVAFHKAVGTINKTAKSYTNEYAPLSEVLSVVTPALSAQGLCITQTFEPGEAGEPPNMITTLHHVSGETVESRLPLVVAKGKNALHDLGSAISYCRRYSLLAILSQVADVDTDGNVEDSPAPTAKPKAAPAKTPPASKPAPVATPTDAPLSKEDHGMVLTMLKGLEKDTLNQLVVAFKSEFDLAESAKVSSHITTQRHVEFINRTLETLQS